jgi:AAA domain/Toprim-like
MPSVNTRFADSGKKTDTDFRPLFETFGPTFSKNGSAEALADECPFCGKANHFYLNVETGQYDCKVCGEHGNHFTFIRAMYQERLDATTDTDYQRLKRLRGLPLQTLKRHGLAWDAANGCWLIPYKSADGKVMNLCRYFEATKKKYMLSGLPAQLYGLDLLSTGVGRTLFLCEGPFDAMALDHQLRENKTRKRYDILAVPGANTFKPEWAEHLQNRTVRIVFDNDEGGRKGQEHVVKVYREAKASCRLSALRWPDGYPDKCDLDDLVQDGVNIAEFTREHCRKIESEQRLNFVRGGEVEDEEKTWIWTGHMPCGSLVSFEGDHGSYKSTIARDLAARVTTGAPMPDGSPLGIPAGDVLYFTGEDSAATVRDIVALHGGDLDRLLIHELELPDGELVDLLQFLTEIEDQVNLTGAKLVVIDPINNFLGDYDVSTDVKARRNVTGKLHSFAKRLGICLLGLRNWGKAAEGSSTQRALGPSSMSHVCRACFHTQISEQGPPVQGKLAWDKVSDAPHPRPIPFSVKDEGGHLRRILWGKTSEPKETRRGGKKSSEKR